MPFSAFTAAEIGERSEVELAGRLGYLDATAIPAARRGDRTDLPHLEAERERIRARLAEVLPESAN